MATPLQIFLESAKKIKLKPLEFLPERESEKLVKDIRSAVIKLKNSIQKKGLSDSRTHALLVSIEENIENKIFDEFRYVQDLAKLADVYMYAPSSDKKTNDLIHALAQEVQLAKKQSLEYHLLIEALQKKAEKIKPAEQEKSDLKILQEIGVFYVLEYTLQVLALWARLSTKGKRAILRDGLSSKEGNLPAYLPLENTFRKDLCLKIYDPVLRRKLLTIFYDYEKILYTEDIKKIGPALKEFNLSLLAAFKQKGLSVFTAVIYKPFGTNVPLEEIINKINALII